MSVRAAYMSHNNNKQQQNKETQNDWQIRTVIGVVSECVIEQAQNMQTEQV